MARPFFGLLLSAKSLAEANDKVNVGDTGWMKPNSDIGETLQGFQQVAYAATVMQKDGLIHIVEMHRESMTGYGMADLIKFVKMR